MSTPLLRVDDLSVHYRTGAGVVVGATGVDLRVMPGELVAVVGESGSGKSSAAAGILQLLPPNAIAAGRVVLSHGGAEHELVGMPEKRRRALRGAALGFVPQATVGALHPTRRVGKHFASVYRAHGVPKAEWAARGADALDAAGIADPGRVLAAYPHELSGGLAQRVVIGLSLAMSPSLLVADEPTSALDVRVQRQVLTVLADAVRARGAGAVLITHNLGVARHFCDRVVVMYGGVVVEHGPTGAIFESPAHPYTRRLLAASSGRPVRSDRPAARAPGSRSVAAVLGRCPFYDACGRGAATPCERELPPLRERDPDHLARSGCHD